MIQMMFLSSLKSIKFGDKNNSKRLIKGSRDGETKFIGTPIEARYRLSRKTDVLKQLQTTCDAHFLSLLVFCHSIRWIFAKKTRFVMIENKSKLMLIDSDRLTISINTWIQLRHSSWRGRDSVADACLAIRSSRAPSQSLIRTHRDRHSGFACRRRGFSTLVLLLLAYSWLYLCGRTRDNIP